MTDVLTVTRAHRVAEPQGKEASHAPTGHHPARSPKRRPARYPMKGVGHLAYPPHSKSAATHPEATRGSAAHQRARELLDYATTAAVQANVDLFHLKMLNHWRQQSPFVSRTSELAAGIHDWMGGNEELPLFLPTNQSLERACLELQEVIEILTAATQHAHAPGANALTTRAVPKLRAAAGKWHEQHQRMDDYQTRTLLGNEIAQESVKVLYLSIVAATTGFTTGWAMRVGSGTLQSLAATSGVTATATGTAAGGLTAAEQLHAGTFDPGAIAHSALEETARTFAMGLAGGWLTRLFASALTPMLRSFLTYLDMNRHTAKELSVAAIQAVEYDAFLGNVIAVLAGGGAGALIASVQTVLQAQSGRPLSEVEFTKLVVDQLVLAGVYQLAVAVAIRRTNSRFVDLRDRPMDEVLEGKHAPPPDQWGLYEVTGPERRVSVLTQPSRLDSNGAIYSETGVPKEVKAIATALNNPLRADGYLPNALVIDAHGGPTAISPSNKSVADLLSNVLVLKASQGDPRCRQVLLNACFQVDGIGRDMKSNAQRFQGDSHQALRARDYGEEFPLVYTGEEPGYAYAGYFAAQGARPASMGGVPGPMTYEAIREQVDRQLRNRELMLLLAGVVGIVLFADLLHGARLWRSAFEAIGIGGSGDSSAVRNQSADP